jgi:hypothetical protein
MQTHMTHYQAHPLGIAHGFAISCSYTFLLNRLFSFLPDTIDLKTQCDHGLGLEQKGMLLCTGAITTRKKSHKIIDA